MSEIIPHQQTLPDVPAPQPAPVRLLEAALERGADIDTLSRLMDMQERHEANEARKAYVDAKAKFKGECPSIPKTKDGHNSKYTTLDALLAFVGPTLSANGFDWDWDIEQPGDEVVVTCVLTHRYGHSERVPLRARADTTGSKNAVQALGSTITYLRRYTFEAAVGVATGGQDDDGRGSSMAPPAAPSDALMDAANIAARQGTERLREWYKALTAAERRSLKPALDGLKQKAAEALRNAEAGDSE